MKITALFIFVTIMQVSASSFAQKKVSISEENVSLTKVFKEIKKQTSYSFLYTEGMLKNTKPVSLNVNQSNLNDALDKLFADQPLTYTIINNTIVLKEKPIAPIIADLSAKSSEIKGTVKDDKGLPLQGVTVSVEGTSTQTSTDKNGQYKITAQSNQVLAFSFVGFKTQRVPVNQQETINIVLVASQSNLDEVVVTGYTSQSKRSITGSVVNVKGADLKDQPVANINQALEGKVSGLTVFTDGSPAGNVSVRIRGIGTINGSDPLYIIDGVPTTGSLYQINPNDIASISVLKDASSASIYGSRAANGVIIIETKKGKAGQAPQLTFDAYVGTASIVKHPAVLNAQQFANTYFSSLLAAGVTPSDPQLGSGSTPVIPDFLNPVGGHIGDPNTTLNTYDLTTNQIIPANKAGTNWFDAITHAALQQNYNIGVTGGGVGSRYAFSAGYLDREGTVIDNSFDRYSTRINSEFSMLDNKLRIGEDINIAYSENHGQDGTGALGVSYILNPMLPVYDLAGNFAGTRGGTLALGGNFPNPVALQVRGQNDINRNINLLGNIYLEYDILKNLTFRSSFGAEYSSSYGSYFAPLTPENLGNGQTNDLTEITSWYSSKTWTNSLKYDLNINKDNHITVFAGTEAVGLKGQGYSATRKDLFSADPAFRYLIASGGTQSNGASAPIDNFLFSEFAKVDYAFKEKYILNFTIRRDGSSRFIGDNQYGVFPAVGGAWVLSDESFLKNNPIISDLKLKAAYGQTGNQSSASQFGFADLYGADPTSNSYDVNATQTTVAEGIALISRGNPDLKWESTATINIGTDVGLLNNKINFSVEWYKRNTTNMLAIGTLPGDAGAVAPPIINIGKVTNTGVDASANYNNKFGDWHLDVTGTFSTFKNNVVSIDGNPNTFLTGGAGGQQDVATRTQAGHPISSFYGLIETGVIQSGPNAGNFNFKDLNHDGIIDDRDKTYLGSPFPDFMYSSTINIDYKQFGIEIFLRGTQGNKVWNWTKYLTDFANDEENRSTRVLNAWTPTNHSNTLAQFNIATAGNNSRASSYYLEDGSFLKVQNVQLDYNFTNIPRIKRLKLYVQAQNLFTFTKYTGVNPEVVGNNLGIGVDNQANYPIPRVFLVGVNASF